MTVIVGLVGGCRQDCRSSLIVSDRNIPMSAIETVGNEQPGVLLIHYRAPTVGRVGSRQKIVTCVCIVATFSGSSAHHHHQGGRPTEKLLETRC